ncbi:hypothetical protein B0H12DRAFT_1079743 [Mycena haematopus]|nr:hypothetical protein B0H12DRAFT_1079743 [Mycena haematopus]
MAVQSQLCWHPSAHHEDRQLRYELGNGKVHDRHARAPKKIQLFPHHKNDRDDGQPPVVLRINQGPPSSIITDLPGHTPAENQARSRIIYGQRAALEAEAGYARVLAQIMLLADLTDVEACARARERTRRIQDARNQVRRDKKDAQCRAEHEQWLASRPSLPQPNKIRLIYPQGKRAQRTEPLTEDDLYLTAARPEFLAHPLILHVEAAQINSTYPGWNTSEVEYSWDGLQFPPLAWMAKRKPAVAVDEEDFNDGSDSDDSADGYVPRQSVPRIHRVPDESTTITTSGRSRLKRSTVPTPASPAKKSRVALNVDAAPAPTRSGDLGNDWSRDFEEFDAEYGPGMDRGPRGLRDSVSWGFCQPDWKTECCGPG